MKKFLLVIASLLLLAALIFVCFCVFNTDEDRIAAPADIIEEYEADIEYDQGMIESKETLESADDKVASQEKESLVFDAKGDADILKRAPRDQNFPKEFIYNGQKVIVNLVFTGIPIDSVLSYKAFYAFEGGATVFECCLNGENRKLLVDTSGEILDTNYPRHTTVTDYKKITHYDGATLKSVEADDTRRFFLQDPQGKTLSDMFDYISCVYNGLSVVQLDEKIGFIDSQGNTLLEPCIEYDRLFYPPNREGFWIKYMTEDAFVLPIDGEFAIITLTRTPLSHKVVSVDFPEDFSYAPFEFGDPKPFSELEFGEYIPWAIYNGRFYDRHGVYYDHVIFDSKCESLDEALGLWEKLNGKYFVEAPIVDGFVFGDANYRITDERYEDAYTDFLFKSRVNYMSEDLDMIGRYRLEYIGEGEIESLDKPEWRNIYEVFENGELTFSHVLEKSPPHKLTYDEIADIFYPIPRLERGYFTSFIDDEYFIYYCLPKTADKRLSYYVWSFESGRVEYEINVPFDWSEKFMTLRDFVGGRYCVFEVTDMTKAFDTEGPIWASYLYDIETGELTLLQNYAQQALVSPDMKYIAYTGNYGAQTGYDASFNMPSGYYIKDLEAGTLYFMEYSEYAIFKGWIRRDKLMEEIE